jgi:UDP-N-acetylglucosamine:LPS N-acetylglucosamine transferase
MDPKSMNDSRAPKVIDLVYFNAGGGHRAAAIALETVIREQGRPWQVRLVNLMEILDPKDVFRKTTGMNPEDLYNSRLARSWNIGLAQELKLLQALIRLSHKSITSQLRRHWRRTKPDMVVSLIPNFNRAMYEALESARPQAPYVTLLTDFADFAPHFWIEPNQAQYFICGTPKAAAQARAMGYEESQIHLTSGMIIRPDFYRESPLDRRGERQKLGLDPDRPTGLVMFGGTGSRVMQGIARRLDDTQLILICGHNAPLAERLSAKTSRAPHLVLGFTSEIRYYMQLSDFFIGKPGPGSISEAVQQGLPVIVVRNTWTMPQERYNTDWVRENHAGIVLDSFRSVRLGVAEIIDRFEEFRAGISHIRNRAVFEIPRILENIMNSGRPLNHSALGSDNARGAAVLD